MFPSTLASLPKNKLTPVAIRCVFDFAPFAPVSTTSSSSLLVSSLVHHHTNPKSNHQVKHIRIPSNPFITKPISLSMASSSLINIQCQEESPLVVVIMGVSGSGKSTVGNMLAEAMGCSFLDADYFHPDANKEKMSKGIPLSDEDRIPWLETLSGVLRDNILNCKSVVLGCSALQKSYREILRTADANYESGSYGGRVMFVCLQAPVEVIAARLEKRAEEGSHFMPATLLQSQLDLLQIDDAEGVIMVDATLSPEAIVKNVKHLLLRHSNKQCIQ